MRVSLRFAPPIPAQKKGGLGDWAISRTARLDATTRLKPALRLGHYWEGIDYYAEDKKRTIDCVAWRNKKRTAQDERSAKADKSCTVKIYCSDHSRIAKLTRYLPTATHFHCDTRRGIPFCRRGRKSGVK
jgi:hypothetical protein